MTMPPARAARDTLLVLRSTDVTSLAFRSVGTSYILPDVQCAVSLPLVGKLLSLFGLIINK
jgi:hypothetical protein